MFFIKCLAFAFSLLVNFRISLSSMLTNFCVMLRKVFKVIGLAPVPLWTQTSGRSDEGAPKPKLAQPH